MERKLESGQRTTIDVFHPTGTEADDISVTVSGPLEEDAAVEVIGAVFDQLRLPDLAAITAFQGKLMARLSQPPAAEDGEPGA